MEILHREKIVVLGMMTSMPVAGVVWQTIHYLVGLERLGYEVYYVEAGGHPPSSLLLGDAGEGGAGEGDRVAAACSFLARVMQRFDLTGRWALHEVYAGRVHGLSEAQLASLYREAALIINLHGGTLPRPEHYATGRLVYLETDPVALQIELYDGVQSTIDFLDKHCAFFTFGENYGRPDCGLPVNSRFHFRPTRQPVVLDLWRSDGPAPDATAPFTTVGNWRQGYRNVWFKGEQYLWSKHAEFLKFLDLPRRTGQAFELALSTRDFGDDDRRLLESHGWRVRNALEFSMDPDAYRRYILASRGEFTVAKDQNVRLRSGWFSDRAATYLAAGRPVVTQETGFGNHLPTGRGLLSFSTIEEAVDAVARIAADYPAHCKAAAAVARMSFDADVVLGRLLEEVGIGWRLAGRAGSSVPGGRANCDASLAATGAESSTTAAPPTWLRTLGGSDRVLLASGLGDGDTGGGLFSFDGTAVRMIDRLSTTGLALAGERLVRLLWSHEGGGSVGELLVYDRRGVRAYHRVDGLTEPHDVAFDGTHFITVSTLENKVLWIAASGEVVRRWSVAGDGDSCHLNSLLIHDGKLYVSAFGRFQKHREWDAHKTDGSGVVIEVGSDVDVLMGLCCPHSPRFLDGTWIVCNSATRELLQLDANTGRVTRRLELRGWTRGIAVGEDVLFVGESANRKDAADVGARASIVVVCRRTWCVLDRLTLPCREVYDLILVPADLIAGLRAGFRTNPVRVAEQDQYELFRRAGVEPVRLWATGDPLPAAARFARIEGTVPSEIEAGATIEVDCVVENVGGAFLVTAPPNPVHVSYRWKWQSTGYAVDGTEGLRTPLPRTLPPRQPVACKVAVQAPPTPGDCVLHLTLVQEHVAWFDDGGLENASVHRVHVTRPVTADAGVAVHGGVLTGVRS